MRWRRPLLRVSSGGQSLPHDPALHPPPTLEALQCFTLGLRDALRLRLALVSILIWTLALVFWGVVLAVFHAEAAALVGQALSTLWAAAPSWMNPAVAVAQNPWVQGTVSFLLLMLGYWIVCLITVSLLNHARRSLEPEPESDAAGVRSAQLPREAVA